MSDFPELLAAELGVTRRQVTRMCAARKIPGAYRTKGGHWRLRKTYGRLNCDRRIAEFILRYTSDCGYFRPVSEADQAKLLNHYLRLLREDKLHLLPAERFEWAVFYLRSYLVDQLEALTASELFNLALEFSNVAMGISRSDLPSNLRDFKAWQRFKERDPEKFRYVIETPLLKAIHPRALEAISQPRSELEVKREKLLVDRSELSPAALARELCISVATLYRRYGQPEVRRACRPRVEHAEAAPLTEYQIE